MKRHTPGSTHLHPLCPTTTLFRSVIFSVQLGNFACITGLQHFSEARDGCQRSPQFIAHVGNESRLDLIRLLQRGIALAQRLLDAAAVGHVQHGEERIPVRQRNGCKFKTLSIGKCNAAAALLAVDRRSEEGSGGKEGVRKWRYRWGRYR